MSQSTELDVEDQEDKSLALHLLVSILEWGELVTQLSAFKSLVKSHRHGCFCEYMEILCKTEFSKCSNQPHCEKMSMLQHHPLAACPGCRREGNLPSPRMTVPSLQSVPSSNGGRCVPSLRKSILGPNLTSRHLAMSVTNGLSERVKSDVDPSPKCIEAREVLKLHLFCPSAKSPLHKSKGQKKL